MCSAMTPRKINDTVTRYVTQVKNNGSKIVALLGVECIADLVSPSFAQHTWPKFERRF